MFDLESAEPPTLFTKHLLMKGYSVQYNLLKYFPHMLIWSHLILIHDISAFTPASFNAYGKQSADGTYTICCHSEANKCCIVLG